MKTQINEIRRMQQLAGILNESQLNESIELNPNDLGPEFMQIAKEIFGDTVKIQNVEATYRPSTDTGCKPHLYMGVTIPSVGDRDNYKGVLLNIGFFNKEGKGVVNYDNYSKDKQSTAEEFNTKLIPAFKKAAALILGKLVKNPQELSQATVGSGYKYEEKDHADLDKYVSELPNLPLTLREAPSTPSDVAALDKAQSSASTVASKSKNINSIQEFPGAFEAWFQTLGFEPGKISKSTVRSEVEKVLTKLGYK